VTWSPFRRRPLLRVAADQGTGPAVILLHGVASSWVTFQNLVPLIEPRHRVIALDLLGFGGSPAPDDAEYTPREHVAYVHRTLRALRLRGPIVIVGHSMGAIIAARYAAQFPRRVSRVVLVSPPVYLSPTSVGKPLDRAAMDLYLQVYRFLRSNKDFTIRAAAQLARLSPIPHLLDVSERNWRAFVLSLEKSIETQTTLSDLAEITAPVEIVYGTLDPFLAPVGLRIASSMRGVTSHRVVGGDHVVRPRMARVVATAIG
jgi:pimeloyl-ACP methyl ester carboxylesterase